MGILPLQYATGESTDSLGLTGREFFDVEGLSQAVASGFANGRMLEVRARRDDGSTLKFSVTIRIDTPQEVLYYLHGGILRYVLRQLLGQRQKPSPIAAPVVPETPQPSTSAQVDEGSMESFPASDPPSH